jgi:hypothetical protein
VSGRNACFGSRTQSGVALLPNESRSDLIIIVNMGALEDIRELGVDLSFRASTFSSRPGNCHLRRQDWRCCWQGGTADPPERQCPVQRLSESGHLA